jgi:Uma2 family endonuclease
MVAEPVQRIFTIDEYYEMGRAGILTADDRVELIEGKIIQMPPVGEQHASRVNRLNEMFILAFSTRAMVITQNPLRMGQFSEPEPDIVLARRRADFYSGRHPTPSDAFLVAEVSHSSLLYDRSVKLPLYAREGVPEVWLVEIEPDQVTVHRDPSPEGFRTSRVFRRGESITVAAFPDTPFSVDDILG